MMMQEHLEAFCDTGSSLTARGFAGFVVVQGRRRLRVCVRRRRVVMHMPIRDIILLLPL